MFSSLCQGIGVLYMWQKLLHSWTQHAPVFNIFQLLSDPCTWFQWWESHEETLPSSMIKQTEWNKSHISACSGCPLYSHKTWTSATIRILGHHGTVFLFSFWEVYHLKGLFIFAYSCLCGSHYPGPMAITPCSAKGGL